MRLIPRTQLRRHWQTVRGEPGTDKQMAIKNDKQLTSLVGSGEKALGGEPQGVLWADAQRHTVIDQRTEC